MTEKQNKIILQAISKYGSVHQIEILLEECNELIHSLHKLKRMKLHDNQYPNKSYTIEECLVYWNVCSEIADVKIMLAQMEMIFNKEAIDLAVERKIERLEQRINHEKQ